MKNIFTFYAQCHIAYAIIHPCRKQSGAAKGKPHSVNLPRVETWNRSGDRQSALAMATDSKAHFNKCASQSTKEFLCLSMAWNSKQSSPNLVPVLCSTAKACQLHASAHVALHVTRLQSKPRPLVMLHMDANSIEAWAFARGPKQKRRDRAFLFLTKEKV